jgi:putative addiction module component (TIGR02574 family)
MMSQTLEKLKREVETLSSQEQVELAPFLLSILGPEETEAEAEKAWDAELARRVADIESGKVVGIPAAEVFARLREKYS